MRNILTSFVLGRRTVEKRCMELRKIEKRSGIERQILIKRRIMKAGALKWSVLLLLSFFITRIIHPGDAVKNSDKQHFLIKCYLQVFYNKFSYFAIPFKKLAVITKSYRLIL